MVSTLGALLIICSLLILVFGDTPNHPIGFPGLIGLAIAVVVGALLILFGGGDRVTPDDLRR